MNAMEAPLRPPFMFNRPPPPPKKHCSKEAGHTNEPDPEPASSNQVGPKLGLPKEILARRFNPHVHGWRRIKNCPVETCKTKDPCDRCRQFNMKVAGKIGPPPPAIDTRDVVISDKVDTPTIDAEELAKQDGQRSVWFYQGPGDERCSQRRLGDFFRNALRPGA